MAEGKEGESEGEMRVRIPRRDEVLGKVVSLVGGGRLVVECQDGNERLCRIPGKIKRKIWVKDGDIVVVKPWSVGGDKRGDIVWRYTSLQVEWLEKKGYMKGK
ncbi:MAG: translation initiation factor eIF-1A [Candidatus Micrarchaeia archaeon]